MIAGPRVLLVGMMGSGKSTVGQALAGRTGWRYLDNDELVELATGHPTPEVLSEGEETLRAAESAALAQALREATPLVASVAAGVVDSAGHRASLRAGGFVVWLRARIETLVAHVGSGEGRPWLQPDPETALRRLYDGRAERYAEVATVVVDVDQLDPDAIAARILTALPQSPKEPRT